jgi:rhodanese-related sulfurtransferase
MTPRYFHGQPHEMGSVTALPQDSFTTLCTDVLSHPIPLPVSRSGFKTLTKKEQNAAKRVRYIVPSIFPQSPSPRTTESATRCNLIALDVDEADASRRILANGWEALGSFGYAIWHTASSTAEAPRIRVLVNAEGITLAKYPLAVRTIADLLGIQKVSRESLVPVQPMYLPIQFNGSEDSPLVHLNPAGEAFTALDIQDGSEPVDTIDPEIVDPTDFAHLKAPMEGVEVDDIEEALTKLNADCGMQEWVEVGMALKHQFGDEGFLLWDEWSARGKKYDGTEATHDRWNSFKAHPTNRAPVTIRSVIKKAVAEGWKSDKVAERTRTALQQWISSSARSSEELLDQGAARIASASAVLRLLERKALMSTLKSVLGKKDIAITIYDVQKQVRKHEIEERQKQSAVGWARGLCYVTALNIFYRHATDRRFKPEVIDLMYSMPSPEGESTMAPKNYLIQVAQIPQVENLRYEPKLGEKRFFTEHEIPYVNTYRPTNVASDSSRAEEAGEIFMAHMKHLIGEMEHRRTLIDFLAYQVQHPGKKVRWAPLIQSHNGAGKGFLGEMMGLVLGQRNVGKVAAGTIMKGDYNDWAYGSQLVILEEIRIVGQNRHAVMDKIKPLITDDHIALSVKFESARTVPNVSNYMLFTNYRDALAINDDDRRYFVLCSPLQRSEQIAEMGGDKYFDTLYGVLKDNPGGMLAWLEQWKISAGFKPEGRAPITKYLREMAENAASPLAAAVRQAICDQVSPLVRSDLISLTALRGSLNDREGIGHFSDQALGQVLQELGWVKSERISLEGTRHSMYVHGSAKISDVRVTAQQRLDVL